MEKYRNPRDIWPSVTLACCVAALLGACGADPVGPGAVRRGTGSGAAGRIATGVGAGGGPGSTGFPGSAGPSGGVLPGATSSNSCAGTNVQAGRKQPLVMLVIDGSGSMCAPFASATRWTALRSALLDPDGIVTKLQGAVSFGMALYDGPLDFTALLGGGGPALGGGSQNPQCALMGAQNSMGKACPNMIEVPQALNNAQAISAMYPMVELGGSTPTHKTMTAVVDKLTAVQSAPDTVMQPQYIVLATDGEPNELCANPSGLDPRAEVIKQVARAAQANIKTFVISLAGDDANLMAHLVQVAEAGMSGYPPFTPMSKEDLVTSLGQIIGGAVGCEVFLNGKVTLGQECAGKVAMNSVDLACNDPNGWSLLDDHTLKLQGQACTSFQADPLSILRADFPCGVFVPQ